MNFGKAIAAVVLAIVAMAANTAAGDVPVSTKNVENNVTKFCILRNLIFLVPIPVLPTTKAHKFKRALRSRLNRNGQPSMLVFHYYYIHY